MRVNEAIKKFTPVAPRIILLDIETTPALSYHWRYWDERIAPNQMVKTSELLCFAAKSLGARGMFFASRQGDADDRDLAKEAWDIVDQADIVIAHNGRAFDMKTLNARWAFWGLPPPGPYKIIDTCLVARKEFNFPANSLNALALYFNLGAKQEHEGFDLWKKCIAGDPSAWKRMEKYNIRDVELLEQIYLRLRAYDRRHPNVGAGQCENEIRCVCCGNKTMKRLPGLYFVTTKGYPIYRCRECGKVSRDNTAATKVTTTGRNV